MKTIVTITPLPIEKDSRTFKQAASIARYGYNSVVVEGSISNINHASLPFKLRSLPKIKLFDCLWVYRRFGFIRRIKNNIWFKRCKKLWHLSIAHIYKYFLLTLLWTPRGSVYYLHAFYQFPAVYVLCRIYNTPFIYDAHDFYSKMEETESVSLYQRYLLWLETQCINQAAAVITVSNGLAELHEKEFGQRSIVIRNCHDTRLDTKPPLSIRKSLNLKNSDFLMVIVGNSKSGQAIYEILEVMTNLPSKVHLALLGRRYDSYIETIKKLNLDCRVHILSPVKPSEVVQFISTADISIILYYPHSINYLNALPNKFFQSISANLPILYPELPEIKNIAEQYKLGLPIDPQSPASIQSAVMSLLQSPKLLAMYKQKSKLASLEIDWKHEEVLLKSVIREVFDARNSASRNKEKFLV